MLKHGVEYSLRHLVFFPRQGLSVLLKWSKVKRVQFINQSSKVNESLSPEHDLCRVRFETGSYEAQAVLKLKTRTCKTRMALYS